MNRTKSQLVSEARFRAGMWLKSDVECGAIESIKETYPDLTDEELVAIEREITRIANLLIGGGTPR